MSAATGGMRTAFRAGPIAETTVTSVPTASPTIAVRGSNVSGPVGRVVPNPLSSASSPMAASHAEADADGGRDEPDDRRLGQHGAQHLSPARADDPQQGEFPRPLADDDRERVVDGERADEQRDQREDQQRRVEERQRLAHRVLRPRR